MTILSFPKTTCPLYCRDILMANDNSDDPFFKSNERTTYPLYGMNSPFERNLKEQERLKLRVGAFNCLLCLNSKITFHTLFSNQIKKATLIYKLKFLFKSFQF